MIQIEMDMMETTCHRIGRDVSAWHALRYQRAHHRLFWFRISFAASSRPVKRKSHHVKSKFNSTGFIPSSISVYQRCGRRSNLPYLTAKVLCTIAELNYHVFIVASWWRRRDRERPEKVLLGNESFLGVTNTDVDFCTPFRRENLGSQI